VTPNQHQKSRSLSLSHPSHPYVYVCIIGVGGEKGLYREPRVTPVSGVTLGGVRSPREAAVTQARNWRIGA
jgi:hypothetical protein